MDIDPPVHGGEREATKNSTDALPSIDGDSRKKFRETTRRKKESKKSTQRKKRGRNSSRGTNTAKESTLIVITESEEDDERGVDGWPPLRVPPGN